MSTAPPSWWLCPAAVSMVKDQDSEIRGMTDSLESTMRSTAMSEEKNMDRGVVVSFCVAALKCGWRQGKLSKTLLNDILTLLPWREHSRILLFRSGELEDDIQWIKEHADAALEFRNAWRLLACLVIGVADMPGGGWQCSLAKNIVHRLAVQCLAGQVAVPRPMLAHGFLAQLRAQGDHFTKTNVYDEGKRRPRCGNCGHTYKWLSNKEDWIIVQLPNKAGKPKVGTSMPNDMSINWRRRQSLKLLCGITRTGSAQPERSTSNNGISSGRVALNSAKVAHVADSHKGMCYQDMQSATRFAVDDCKRNGMHGTSRTWSVHGVQPERSTNKHGANKIGTNKHGANKIDKTLARVEESWADLSEGPECGTGMWAGDDFVRMGADNLIAPGFMDKVKECMETGNLRRTNACLWGKSDNSGTCGKVGMWAEDFARMGGYDTTLLPMGYEDVGSFKRLL